MDEGVKGLGKRKGKAQYGRRINEYNVYSKGLGRIREQDEDEEGELIQDDINLEEEEANINLENQKRANKAPQNEMEGSMYESNMSAYQSERKLNKQTPNQKYNNYNNNNDLTQRTQYESVRVVKQIKPEARPVSNPDSVYDSQRNANVNYAYNIPKSDRFSQPGINDYRPTTQNGRPYSYPMNNDDFPPKKNYQRQVNPNDIDDVDSLLTPASHMMSLRNNDYQHNQNELDDDQESVFTPRASSQNQTPNKQQPYPPSKQTNRGMTPNAEEENSEVQFTENEDRNPNGYLSQRTNAYSQGQGGGDEDNRSFRSGMTQRTIQKNANRVRPKEMLNSQRTTIPRPISRMTGISKKASKFHRTSYNDYDLIESELSISEIARKEWEFMLYENSSIMVDLFQVRNSYFGVEKLGTSENIYEVSDMWKSLPQIRTLQLHQFASPKGARS